MRKPLLILLLVVILAGAWAAWNLIGPVVSSEERYFYIPTGSRYEQVKEQLHKQDIIPNTFFFNLVAKRVKYDQRVRPGRYEIKKGTSVINLVRMLKRGAQSPVRLVINKLRTKEDLAGKLAANFETDSAAIVRFLNSPDSLSAWNLDSNTSMTAIIPNTYELLWNTSFRKIFARLEKEQDMFWTPERRQKAGYKNLTTAQVYTMASIVEEETNDPGDKLLIASVYINRIKKGMKLEADPTVKYAMRNFGLKRILHGHLAYPSPYNTYRQTGLPPGPIATPSPQTIDAVLNAPETDYIFFVAKPDFNGRSNFASTYAQHLIFAKAYQRALDSLILSKKTN